MEKKLIVDFIKNIEHNVTTDDVLVIKDICTIEAKEFRGTGVFIVPKKYRSVASKSFVQEMAYLRAVINLIDSYIEDTGDKDKELIDGASELTSYIADMTSNRFKNYDKILEIRSRKGKDRGPMTSTYLVDESGENAIKL